VDLDGLDVDFFWSLFAICHKFGLFPQQPPNPRGYWVGFFIANFYAFNTL
jgi:hypothetical protein